MSNNKNILIITNEKLDDEEFFIKKIKKNEYRIFNFIDNNLENIEIVDINLILLYHKFKEDEGIDILKKLKSNTLISEIPVIVVLESRGTYKKCN